MTQAAPRADGRPDVAVVGAGAIGLATAKAVAARGHTVVVFEKEADLAAHQSGRNSGVIHAGYNLSPGSEKARYCVEGSRRLRSYCMERGIAVEVGGILVVGQDERDAETLRELERRARGNGVAVRMLDEAGARQVEPHVRARVALHAPDGASFDATAYVRALASDVRDAGGTIRFGARIRDVDDVHARVVVNAAGLHADRLAGALCPDMRIVPFRGYYAELLPARAHLVRSHVYAAPDLEFPFLGVHLSRRADGRVLVGPGAMLAFGREAYRFWHVNARDLASTLAWPGLWRFLSRRRVLSFVRSEVAKSLSRSAIAREASALVPGLAAADLGPAFAGNRAQMIRKDGRLVEDIVVRETERAVHVLNAVSPGLTCSLPFGEALAARALAKL